MGKKNQQPEGYAPIASDTEDEPCDHHSHGGHGHHDGHAHGERLSARSRLIIAMVLNLGYTFAELGAYYAFDSLAMLADAVHNLSDVVSIVIAYRIEGMKTASDRHRYTFGVKRAEVLGGVLNGTVLLSLCLYVICDAVPRLVEPPVMQITPWFIGIAMAGVPVNIGTACLFIGSAVRPQHAHSHGSAGHGHSHGDDGQCPSEAGGDEGNLNLWAVFLHNMGDALTSVGVSIVAVLLYTHGREEDILAGNCASGKLVFGSLDEIGPESEPPQTELVSCAWTDYLDAGVSVFLSMMISLSVMPLLRQGLPVLLDSSPVGIDLAALQSKLSAVEDVASVDALHVWNADNSRLVAIVHAEVRHGACRDGAATAIRAVMSKQDISNTSVQITEATGKHTADHGHDDEEHGHSHSGGHGHDDHGHDKHGHDDHSHSHEKHGHDDHGHSHDDHGHSHDDHGHEKHAHDEHGHDDHRGHAHGDDGSCDHEHGHAHGGKPTWPWKVE